MKKTFYYGHWQELALHATFYPASQGDAGITLFYFHGGGLIYGNRDDLPAAYIDGLNGQGYHLLTFDYPLVPEVSLKAIYQSLNTALTWFKSEYQRTLNLSSADYCLFGRSAGAYLSLLLGSQQKDQNLKGIISFYGYYTLKNPAFNQGSSYYQKYPAIPYMTLYELTQGRAKSQATINERFPIYLSYRQTGQWAKMLLGQENIEDYSLTEKQLRLLPPTFLAASSGDRDVPYAISEKMAQLIPETYFYQVKDEPHDFDADSSQQIGQEAYEQLATWLQQFRK